WASPMISPLLLSTWPPGKESGSTARFLVSTVVFCCADPFGRESYASCSDESSGKFAGTGSGDGGQTRTGAGRGADSRALCWSQPGGLEVPRRCAQFILYLRVPLCPGV